VTKNSGTPDALIKFIELALVGNRWVNPRDGSLWAVCSMSNDGITLGNGVSANGLVVTFRQFAEEWSLNDPNENTNARKSDI